MTNSIQPCGPTALSKGYSCMHRLKRLTAFILALSRLTNSLTEMIRMLRDLIGL